MAGRNSYQAYRGKRSGGKRLLAGVLVLVILAAVAVLLVQKYIVYDTTGEPRLEVPWKETEETAEEPPVELDLVIRPVEVPASPHGWLLPAAPLTAEDCRAALAKNGSAVAVTVKDGNGTVYVPLPSVPETFVAPPEAEALPLLLESACRPVARITCFRDGIAAAAYGDTAALKTRGGALFRDGEGGAWLDPAKSAARDYLCTVAREAAELGFREILLTDITYPITGDLTGVAYGTGLRRDHLQTFLQEMRAALEPYGVTLSVELPAEVILAGELPYSGQILADIAPLVDRVYAQIAPEQASACAAAVTAAAETAVFIPVLNGVEPAGDGECLLQ